MTEPEPLDGVDLGRGEARLAAAADQLREVAPADASHAAWRVLRTALATPRRAELVRAEAPRDHLRVSTLAIVTVLRERLDAALTGAAVSSVRLSVDDERLVEGTVELYVRYGVVVEEVAERARALAATTLAELLGDTRPAGPVHVHVADVTIGDPHLVDPADE